MTTESTGLARQRARDWQDAKGQLHDASFSLRCTRITVTAPRSPFGVSMRRAFSSRAMALADRSRTSTNTGRSANMLAPKSAAQPHRETLLRLARPLVLGSGPIKIPLAWNL